MSRVLLTNDDGIEAAGLQALRDALVAEGMDVLVVAPDGNRSAMGHRVTVRESITLERVDKTAHIESWSCSGTPADCVRMAYFEPSFPRFDAVVSGINHGVNLGEDTYYSGTIAAAVEGVLLGLPSIASSQQAGEAADAGFLSEAPKNFPYAAYVARVARSLTETPPRIPIVLNVNLPSLAHSNEVVITELGRRDWTSSSLSSRIESDRIIVDTPWASDPGPDLIPGTDFHAIVSGRASLTPLDVRSGIRGIASLWANDSLVPLSLN